MSDAAWLLAAFRSEVYDQVAPYLWSDNEVISFIDHAQQEFCRMTDGIRDDYSPDTRIILRAGRDWAYLNPLILEIRRAWRVSDKKPVAVLNIEDLDRDLGLDDYGFPRNSIYTGVPGEVRAIVVGGDEERVRILDTPQTNDYIQMSVYRLPLEQIGSVNDNLEISQKHIRSLLLWMKHLAYNKHDAETYDRARAERYGAEFRFYCDRVKSEDSRRNHQNRPVAYAGL